MRASSRQYRGEGNWLLLGHRYKILPNFPDLSFKGNNILKPLGRGRDKMLNRNRHRDNMHVETIRQGVKTTMNNMLQDLVKNMDNMYEQMVNFTREKL